MSDGASAYPLAWPTGRPRTAPQQRKPARFRTDNGSYARKSSTDVTVSDALERLTQELERLGARYVVLSTNLELRLDGKPRSNQTNQADPGAALYFQLKGKPIVLACDRWTTVAANMAAIAAHIDALRGQERWGVGSIEQAFAGFAALPAPGAGHWRAVLGFRADQAVDRDMIQAKRREMAKLHHADAGGAGSRMAEINAAADDGIGEIGTA